MGFDKILIANRGEIAVRVIRTARRMGYRTVAVYSDADAAAAHVVAADEAVHLGGSAAADSYLRIDAVIDAARASGAGAIHPGYGFLSENAAFAQACLDAGIVFIGPPVGAIELMGNKRAAKQAMLAAGVPCVPGFQSDDPSDDVLLREAESIGFPIMVKAAAGGGGRGMRLVSAQADLAAALTSARAEAKSAFGSGELILEKAVVRPRHVEIQVFADAHGQVVHLGERDCSIQRRHQKVIEECPSPAVDEALRKRMGGAAVEAARACDYRGAGTVEFLLDDEGKFYFLEMNTRLQVEHPVTELVTGVDLVEWQLRVARGEALPLTQNDIVFRGHAIEARLYAEDPARGFMPQTGRVLRFQLPTDGEVRVDAGVSEGGTISPHYDPMIAKVVAHGSTREDARRKLVAALRTTTVMGVVTNKSFLAALCDHPVFAAGEATTAFIGEHFDQDPTMAPARTTLRDIAPAALVAMLAANEGRLDSVDDLGWRSAGPLWSTLVFADDAGRELELSVQRIERGFEVRLDADDEEAAEEGERMVVELAAHNAAELTLRIDGVARRLSYGCDGSTIWIDDGVRVARYRDRTHAPAMSADAAGSGRMLAPLDGAVTQLSVAPGDRVSSKQLLLVMEAMKMEHRIVADVDGSVSAVHVAVGQQVKTRQLLVEIEPSQEEAG